MLLQILFNFGTVNMYNGDLMRVKQSLAYFQNLVIMTHDIDDVDHGDDVAYCTTHYSALVMLRV